MQTALNTERVTSKDQSSIGKDCRIFNLNKDNIMQRVL